MSVAGEQATSQVADGTRTGVNVVRGLLWREWLAHRGLVFGFLSAYLVLGWVLMIFFHPGFVIAFGVLVAILIAPAVAGSDAAEGSEEFAFSLPPRRAERYLVRMGFAGAVMLAFTLFGCLSIALDLPQMFWGIFVNSGFTEPFPGVDPLFLYPLAVAVPFAAFAFTFAIAAVASRRGLVAWSWLLGLFGAGAVLVLGFLCESALWDKLNGYVSITLLAALSAAGLFAGYCACVRKEGVSRPASMQGGGLWWLWLIIIVIAIFFIMSALFWFAAKAPETRSADEAVRQSATPDTKSVVPREVGK
jgi:hypothetical protein